MTATIQAPTDELQRLISETREVASANVRRIATRAIVGSFSGDYYDTLFLLRHLEPGSLATARTAHRFLVRDTIRDLTEVGTCEPLISALLGALRDFIETHGFRFYDGRWTPAERGAA